MRSKGEIEEQRDTLRESIDTTAGEVQKEFIREQSFVLDRVLGLFDTGEVKDQFEVFRLLQQAQTQMKAVPDASDRIHKKAEAAVLTYKWVLQKQ